MDIMQTDVGGETRGAADKPHAVDETLGSADGEFPRQTSTGTAESSRVRRLITSCPRSDHDLWMAVKEGDLKEVARCLQEKVDVNMEVWPDNELLEPLIFKGWSFRAKPIHQAALRGHSAVIELLFAAKADINDNALTTLESKNRCQIRACNPIHMAVGSGSKPAMQLLLGLRANPNALATKDDAPHYYPVHEAAFFDNQWCIDMLVRKKAKIDAENSMGDTPLHLCARYGHSNSAEQILKLRDNLGRSVQGKQDRHSRTLVTKKNNDGETPLDVALKHGQFPVRKLWIFTSCFNGEVESHYALESAFIKVAKACPPALPLLLREGEEDSDLSAVPMSKKWSSTFTSLAAQGIIQVHDLATLVYEAPQGYCDLLEALSLPPVVHDREHHPLPSRVSLAKGSDAFAMSCEYQEDTQWTWNNTSQVQKAWHNSFAPADPKSGVEAKIRVVHLKGMADLELVWRLGSADNLLVLTKMGTHALLKYIWNQLVYVYAVDLVHQVATVIVLSVWTSGDASEGLSRTTRCIMWSIVASFGIAEAIFLGWSLIKLPMFLYERHTDGLGWESLRDSRTGTESLEKEGHDQSWASFNACFKRALHTNYVFVKQWRQEFLLSALSISVAVAFKKDLGPSGNESMILSITIFCHWILLLIRLRAFQWLGKRLLPVMNSVVPISRMVMIVTCLLLGFFHAFWAMDRDNGDEKLLYQVVILLFSGEPFYFVEHLEVLDGPTKSYIIILTILALFIFGCCLVNVFIAVLGQIYDAEQDRVLCTYLQERARICALMLLRPEVHVKVAHNTVTLCFTVAVAATTVFMVHAHIHMDISAWSVACVMAIGFVLIQGTLRGVLTESWSTRSLWYCYEAEVDEQEFLNASQRRDRLHDGGLNQIRKDIQVTSEKAYSGFWRINTKCKQIIQNLSPEPQSPDHIGETGGSATWSTLPGTISSAISGAIGGAISGAISGAITPHGQVGDPMLKKSNSMPACIPPVPPPPTATVVQVRADHGAYAERPRPMDMDITAFSSGADFAVMVAPVATQLACEIAAMRRSIDMIIKRLHHQEENQYRLEMICNQTMKYLEEIMTNAARRREKRRTGLNAPLPLSPGPGSERPVTTSGQPMLQDDKRCNGRVETTTIDSTSSVPVPEMAIIKESSPIVSGSAPRGGESTEASVATASGDRDSAALEEADQKDRKRVSDRAFTLSDKVADVFEIGELCESPDSHGRWWPVKITGIHLDGTYSVDVLDGFDGHWNAVLADKLRPFNWKFAEGDSCEAMNKEGRWWPVTVSARDTDRCTYAVEVHDGQGSQWPIVYPWNLRSSQGQAKEDRILSNQPRGASQA